MTTEPPTAQGVVCIGSSAGGLPSLMAIAGSLPPSFPWAVLITQHFPTDIESRLPEILARVSSLAVRHAVQGDRLSPRVILTCPSGIKLGVAGSDHITLGPRERGRPQTIDHLFTTASSAKGARTTAVILSGMGTDGAAGAVTVKHNGGTVIAEAPQTAEWPGMPTAAIDAGAVDLLLPRQDIGRALTRLAARDRPRRHGE